MNARRERFVAEYLIDLNATQAAIRAGYSEKSAIMTGSRLLTFDDVCEAIEKGKQEQAKRNELSADWILARLKRESELEGKGATHAARIAALNLLGKHFGLFPDKVQHSGSPGQPIEINVHTITERIAFFARNGLAELAARTIQVDPSRNGTGKPLDTRHD